MTSDKMTIRETTHDEPTYAVHDVIHYAVGNMPGAVPNTANIWERDLADDQGVIASRLSANLSIQDLASKQTRVEKVFAGSVLTLGTDRYCVVNVEEGESAPGSISLHKLP